MTIHDIISPLEAWAPLNLQESYDNCGLLTGRRHEPVSGVLVSLDCTEEVIEEAIRNNCNLVISHHPILFQGIKKLNGNTHVERSVILALKHDVALYAMHTNLDNVNSGVNHRIANLLNLKNLTLLQPKTGHLRKLITFCPAAHAEQVREGLANAGAGQIGNYDNCTFNTTGKGTFRALRGAQPFVGKPGEIHTEDEVRIETVYYTHRESAILTALRESHPYEEIAYDIIALANSSVEFGSGIIGELEEPTPLVDFLTQVKSTFRAGCIRHTHPIKQTIKRVALCGGSGAFLISSAIRGGADLFLTSDVKYHEFFNAESKIVIADIGHYESEQFTVHLITEFLKEKFPTFAIRFSEVNTNPINYF